MDYRAIGFDYGGVIYGRPGTQFNLEVAKLAGLPVDTVMREYFTRNHQANVGTVSYDEVWCQVFSALDRSEKYAEFLTFQTAWGAAKKLNPAVLALSDTLRAAGYKTGILSNANSAMAEDIRQEKIDTHFDIFLPSCELGFMKPDRRAYEALAKALDVEPRAMIFVDDTPKSLESAQAVGYTPILFESYATLVLELQSLGISVPC